MCCELAFCKIINSYWSVPSAAGQRWSISPVLRLSPSAACGSRGGRALGDAAAAAAAAGAVWLRVPHSSRLTPLSPGAQGGRGELPASLAQGLVCSWRHVLADCAQGKGSGTELGQASICKIAWGEAVGCLVSCAGGGRAGAHCPVLGSVTAGACKEQEELIW